MALIQSMLTYPAFIDELRSLITRGKALGVPAELSEDSEFRRWRKEVTYLVEMARQYSYAVSCDIQLRRFNIKETYEPVALKSKQKRFQMDLSDTLNELEVIVASFDKFGDPNSTRARGLNTLTQSPLSMPEKVTLAWLGRNAPLGFWLWVVTAVVVIFGVGLSVGQSAYYTEFLQKLKPVSNQAGSIK